ncbi:MAG: iron-sulfur cluster insertion protein ErpA [Elusimicrobia bacterium]|nr:iron-sulfur cluster insertion protein ErpA [Elusimicrobiota bacterium]
MVTLTEPASQKVKELLAKQAAQDLGLRVFVQAGGCRGFSYGMAFDKKQEGDTVSDLHGITVLVDANSVNYLDGVTIDYKDAMMGGGFTINNPNATSTCGCGQSFKAKGEQGSPKSCCG